MERFKVFLRKSAADELDALSGKVLRNIIAKIRELEANPRPPGCRKLSADEKCQLRQGDFRIVYSVRDKEKTVVIVKIGHRKDIYR
ncbi:MAG: type II toxin-antitoxin system RelE/ParE family toxin [Candidatus Aminicenantes bacterium]|nr:type II toxin-antitoxin system RelE/ParE family toxin [Candidatus Aminicenantes bacterium]